MAKIEDAVTGYDADAPRPTGTPRDQWIRRISKYDFNMFRALANSPDVYRAFNELSVAVYVSELPPRTREAVILRTAAVVGSDYEWGGHVEAARAAGLSDETIVGLREGRMVGLDDLEIAAVQLAESVEGGRPVPDVAWKTLSEEYSRQQMLELTMLAGFYGLASRFTKALEVELDEGWVGLDQP